MVPDLRFPEFQDAGDWEEKKIGDLTDVTAGGTPSTDKAEYWGGHIPWMNSGDLNQKQVTQVAGRISEKGLKNSSTKLIPKHSILIGLAGQGKTRGTVATNLLEVCINQSIGAILPNDSKFYADYLYHNLDGRYSELRNLSAGDGGRGGLNLSILKNLSLPIPSLTEQQKIADCLSSLDEVISLESQKLQSFQSYKKGLLQNLFPAEGETVPKLRFPEFVGKGDWEERKLGDFIIPYSEKVKSTTEIPVFTSSREGLKPQKDYYDGREIINEGEYGVVPMGYFVYRHMSDDGLFRFNFNNLYDRIAVSKEYPVFQTKGMNSYFLLSILNESSDFKAFALSQKKGGTRTRLYLNTLNSWETLIPSLPEQQKIADCLSTLDALIQAQSERVEGLKSHKKGLLQGLFPVMGDN